MLICDYRLFLLYKTCLIDNLVTITVQSHGLRGFTKRGFHPQKTARGLNFSDSGSRKIVLYVAKKTKTPTSGAVPLFSRMQNAGFHNADQMTFIT